MNFWGGMLVGLLFGLPPAATQCFNVQPAHAGAEDVSHAINNQTRVLERLVRATEKCHVR